MWKSDLIHMELYDINIYKPPNFSGDLIKHILSP